MYFTAPDIAAAGQYIVRMFSFTGNGADALMWFSPYTCLILAAGVLLAAPVFPSLRRMLCKRPEGAAVCRILGSAGSFVLLFFCIMLLASSSFNPFIYYNF